MRAVITWEQLLIYLSVFLVVYYAFIFLLFYRRELFGLAKREPVKSMRVHSVEIKKESELPDAVLYNSVLELMEHCKPVFQAAIQQQLEKEQILEGLRVRLREYPQIKGTAFQISMTSHIAQELDHRLHMVLTDEETELLWL